MTILHENRPKPFHFAIVDEVDSVLIDEGRNPLLISGEVSLRVICIVFFPLCSRLSLSYSIFRLVVLKKKSVELIELNDRLFLASPNPSVSQASKDAARYPVAAKVAELLIQGIVSTFSFISFYNLLCFFLSLWPFWEL